MNYVTHQYALPAVGVYSLSRGNVDIKLAPIESVSPMGHLPTPRTHCLRSKFHALWHRRLSAFVRSITLCGTVDSQYFSMVRAAERQRYQPSNDENIVLISDDEEEEVELEEEDEDDVAPSRRRPRTNDPSTQSVPVSAAGPAGFSALPEAQQDELVQRFVRIMMCRGARRRPIKRADLTRQLFNGMHNIGSKQRVFTGLFARAQAVLRANYGAEVVHIAKRARRGGVGGVSQSQRHSASMTASQSSASFVRGYILVSALPAMMRGNDKESKERRAEIGFMAVVASIILLSPGATIDEEDLHRFLERLGVFVRQRNGHKQINHGNVKDLLERDWPEQWYLERDREGNGFAYSLGPRLLAEIDDDQLIQFIEAVYQLGGDENSAMDDVSKSEIKRRIEEARKEGRPDDEDE